MDTVRSEEHAETLRCYAYGRGNEWEAICIDFDMAVHGRSFEEVQASLAESLRLFLETVADLPPEERRRFLKRQSPWHVRAKLACMELFHSVCRKDASRKFTPPPELFQFFNETTSSADRIGA